MGLKDFLLPFINFMLFLPTTLLCLAPAHNHLRERWSHTVIRLSILITCTAVALSFFALYISRDWNFLYIPAFIIIFCGYHFAMNVHISQSFSIFLLVCAFTTFISNFSIVFDAFLHPDGNLADFSFTASIFEIALVLLFCSLAAYPAAKFGGYLIDHLQQHDVWWSAGIVSTLFFIFNQVMVVRKYSTLHTNMVGAAYIAVMSIMFILLIFLCIVFYFMVSAIIKKAELDDRNHILEMQEKQYESLQQYLNEDAKVRHDFRQTIYTLKELSSAKDYNTLDDYLSRYIDIVPQKNTRSFCQDNALNALLNHYYQRALKDNIKTDIEVSLPGKLHMDSISLCSIVGNILENAIIACSELPESKRFIHLVISKEQGQEIYIAVSNSFNGKTRQKNGRYLSTHKGGNGIGLISVTATSEQHGGSASFTHDDKVFYSNIMLVDKNEP
ncbi:MAG: GHKL domain-containing protein [Butyrivibrio sp.]|nr:GHKL domain-containing protein [Butyrivibrio sp.]